MTIQQDVRAQAVESVVDLFELDCSMLGGSVYRFSPQLNSNYTAVTFNNLVWNPMPIFIENLQYSGSEAPAKPSLSISNVSKVMLPAIITLGDIVGAKLTHWRTLDKYLGTGSTPSGLAFLPKDIWWVERKEHQNKHTVKWMLTSELNRADRRLPRRLFLKRDFPGLSNCRV